MLEQIKDFRTVYVLLFSVYVLNLMFEQCFMECIKLYPYVTIMYLFGF